MTFMPPEWKCLRAAKPRLALLYDLAYFYYPLPLCPSCRSTTYFPSTVALLNAASAAMPLFRTQSAAEQTSLAPHDSKARLISVTTCRRFMAKPCTPHLHCAACATLQASNCHCKRLSYGRATPVFFLGKENGGRITRHMCRKAFRTCAKKHPRPHGRKK